MEDVHSGGLSSFLAAKEQLAHAGGFEPLAMVEALFPFQQHLAEWAIRFGRGLLLADCGLGKTPVELCFADNAYRKTGRPSLILAPLAVGAQFVDEGDKFGVECARSRDGSVAGPVTVANYESLHKFDRHDYGAVVLDESSCIKSFAAKRRAAVQEFMREIPYRLLATATAAPNDYVELGTSAEALGHLGYMDMLAHFFINDEHSLHPTALGARWRFKRAAEDPFWRWVCSWAKACRKPSDLGFEDGDFKLPPLRVHRQVVETKRALPGYLPGIVVEARTLKEQREERKLNMLERCELAAELVDHDRPAVIWTDFNAEADLLEQMIPDALQVSGSMSAEKKEDRFRGFASGDIRVMITKPKIGAWGLNWQHCSDVVFFVSHSFEAYYQSIRRCWRFGQKSPVDVNIVATPGERRVLDNLDRKALQAEEMMSRLVGQMNDPNYLAAQPVADSSVEVPSWLT